MLIWAVVAGLLSWSLAPIAYRLAWRFNVVDKPGFRKIHSEPVARLGGLAVIAAVALVLVARWMLLPNELLGPSNALRPSSEWGMAFLIALLPILAVSILDDFRHVPAIVRLGAHTLGAGIAVYLGVSLSPIIHLLGTEVWIGWLAAPLSLLWLIGTTNAFNIIDGLDGLAAGLGLISALSLSAVFVLTQQPEAATVSLVLAGAIGGFLPYNMHPARMFLGDAGATSIGFCLGCLAISGGARVSAGFAVLIPVVVLGVPLADTLLAIVRRIIKRLAHADTRVTHGERISVFSADRNHIHHRLLDLGMSHKRAVLVLYGVGGTGAALALLSILMTDQQAGLALVGLLVAGFIGLFRLGYEEFALFRTGFVMRFYDAPALRRSFLVVFVDLCIVVIAGYLTMGLRFDDWRLASSTPAFMALVATMAAITPAAMWAFGLYKGAWRLAGLYDIRRLATAIGVSAIFGYLLVKMMFPSHVSVGLFGIYGLNQVLLSVAARSSYRFALESRWRSESVGNRVVICGAGQKELATLKELMSNPSLGMRPVAFIDDDPRMLGRMVQGYPVVGSIRGSQEVLRELRVCAVVVSSGAVSDDQVRHLSAVCPPLGIKVLRMRVSFDEISAAHSVEEPPAHASAGAGLSARREVHIRAVLAPGA